MTWVVINCNGIYEELNPADGVGRTYPATSYQDALTVAWALSYMWELQEEGGWGRDAEEEYPSGLPDFSLLNLKEGWVTPDGRVVVEVIACDPNAGLPDEDGGREEHVVYVQAELHGPKDDPTSFYLLDDNGYPVAIGRKLEPR